MKSASRFNFVLCVGAFLILAVAYLPCDAAESKKKKADDGGYYGSLTPSPQSEAEAGRKQAKDEGYYGNLNGAAKSPSESATPPASSAADTTGSAAGKDQVPTGQQGKTVETSAAPLPEAPAGGVGATESANSATAVVSPSAAQPRLFLWKGTRKNQTIYLLGTIHVLQKNFYPLPRDIERALGESQTLFVEAIAPDAKSTEALLKLQQKSGLYTAPDRLSKHLSAETLQQLRDYLKWAGESLEMYEDSKPWYVDQLISQAALKRNGFKPEYGLDLWLIKQAKLSSKKVKGLETPESQIALLSGFPDDVQDRALRLSIKQLAELPRFVNEATQAWRTGDDAQMEKLIVREAQQTPDSMLSYDKIVAKRNTSMAESLDKSLPSDGTSFVAVGAAHVVGANGLIKLLEKKGFSFQQVHVTPEYTAGGGGKLRRLSFPEGRFSISLPGNPEMAYRQLPIGNTNLNLRAVFYSYDEHAGNYNVAYMIFPNQVNLSNPAVTQKILDAMASAFSKGTSAKGASGASKVLSQNATTVLGYPGRELLVRRTQGSLEILSKIKMFVAGQYFYMVASEGKQAWLQSPAVNTFMNSLVLNTGAPAGSGSVARSPGSFTPSSANSHFGSTSQSEWQKNFDAERKKFDENFKRSQDNFTRDRNSMRSKWEHNGF